MSPDPPIARHPDAANIWQTFLSDLPYANQSHYHIAVTDKNMEPSMNQPSAEPHACRALATGQAVLLWCIRMWVIELRRGNVTAIAAQQEIDDMLDAMGVRDASPHLKGFMFALSHGATRMIEVHCTCHQWVSPDERAMLDIISLTQAARPFEATLVLRGLVTPEGAVSALHCAEAIGNVLASANHFLPEPEEAVRHYALSPPPSEARPCDMTLH